MLIRSPSSPNYMTPFQMRTCWVWPKIDEVVAGCPNMDALLVDCPNMPPVEKRPPDVVAGVCVPKREEVDAAPA
jgi:hypothetical protein